MNAAPTGIRALIAVVVALVLELARRLRPWPTIEPRPYTCARCKREYLDARALGWHMRGQHPDTYDPAPLEGEDDDLVVGKVAICE